jgi:DNA-binding MarR family transcriptional regulator
MKKNGNLLSDEPAARVARECLAVRLRIVNRVVTRIYDEALRPLGMTVNQMNILAVVEKMSEARPGAIGDVLEMEKSTVSRNVERLRRRGWLRESPGPDARSVLLTTTAQGQAFFRKAMPAWSRAQEKVRRLLGEAGTASLARLGDRFFLAHGNA